MIKDDKVGTDNGNEKPTCGLIMPISAIDECDETHWADVKNVIQSTVVELGFICHLVSQADEVGIIQKNIIENTYSNSIVVCDVSCKNPNVMFELGLRLAFDKPTVIIKDDKTEYSFDTSPVEHLTYPRDLRFNKIIDFKANLAAKVQATYKKSKTDKNYSPFLGHFGTFKVPEIKTETVSKEDYIIEQLDRLNNLVGRLDRPQVRIARPTLKSNSEFKSLVNKCITSDKFYTSKNENFDVKLQKLIDEVVKKAGPDLLPGSFEDFKKIVTQNLQDYIAFDDMMS